MKINLSLLGYRHLMADFFYAWIQDLEQIWKMWFDVSSDCHLPCMHRGQRQRFFESAGFSFRGSIFATAEAG